MNTATLGERAAYVSDMASQLAELMSDEPGIALALRFAALEAGLLAERENKALNRDA